MEPPPTTAGGGNRAEAERLLGVAERLLHNRDLAGSREFALLAQETEPLLDGSDQILAICDVLLASDKRPAPATHHNKRHDWYSILQLDRGSASYDPGLIKRNYRRLALLLHPDKNKYPLADSAFRLVADAWAILSDPLKKSAFDSELRFSPVDLNPNPPHPKHQQHQDPLSQNKLPVRRSPRGGSGQRCGGSPPPPSNTMYGSNTSTAGGNRGGSRLSNFWTTCPYCYVLYEYPRVYEDCCLRCQSCQRAFHAAVVPSLPPLVPGKEAYYCCWGFFPLGFSLAGSEAEKKASVAGNSAFPNWMPPMFGGVGGGAGAEAGAGAGAGASAPRAAVAEENNPENAREEPVVDISSGNRSVGMGVRMGMGATGMVTPKRKRGRPRKTPL